MFSHLEELADELRDSSITDEHWEETRELLADREEKSDKISQSITMSEEKFRMCFSL
jgi:hypothetical protein